MEDTLRYFFSAVFQGFAAIVTLGIMFYLYYMDNQIRKLDDIEKILSVFKPDRLTNNSEEKINYYVEYGIFEYAKSFLLPPLVEKNPTHQIVITLNRYNVIVKQNKLLSDQLKRLFKIAILILILSLLSLFTVGYFQWLNIILFFIGIILIVLSVIFFTYLFKFSKIIIDQAI